jgi:uncharacterized membrane protein YjjP (DUF1212 family)
MPDIFKALASITAWVLFILGWVTGLSAFTMGIISGRLFSTTETPPLILPVFFALGAAEAVLAVVVMLIRKKLE